MRAAGRRGRARLRVGWVAAGTLTARYPRYSALEASVAMRVANNACWIDRRSERLACELYRPRRRYDVVVFFKAMDERCQAEAARIRGYGGRVVFDANVNYYEIWGEYDIAATRPTEQQQRDAIAMTAAADWVVADSTYLLDIARKHNPRASWVPDNVDLALFPHTRTHTGSGRLRLVWSGIAQKAAPLLRVADALAGLAGAELVLVSNRPPEVLAELSRALPCSYVPFGLASYAKLLRGCDVIISPKHLVNGYELAHTEWKITLGMAAGLPAVASPQQSYVEAVGHHGGGRIVESVQEWRTALEELAGDPALRAALGRRARLTVEEHYATPVVARRYEEVLCGVV